MQSKKDASLNRKKATDISSLIFFYGIIPLILLTFPITAFFFHIPIFNTLSFVILFIIYSFIARKKYNSIKYSKLSEVTLIVSISIIINYIISIFFCKLAVLIPCYVTKLYSVKEALRLSLVHIIVFSTFIIAKIIAYFQKKRK